jgi:hypothetical protein
MGETKKKSPTNPQYPNKSGIKPLKISPKGRLFKAFSFGEGLGEVIGQGAACRFSLVTFFWLSKESYIH